MLGRLLRSESLRSAIWFGAGGVGFALGNIVLAKVLAPTQFGIVSLALALNQFGLTFGPFGLEIVANRHRPRVGRRLGALAAGSATLTAVIVAAVAAKFYELPRAVVWLLFAMVVGSATNRVCVALFQADHRMRSAMALLQVHNYMLLIAAGLAVALSLKTETFAIALMAVSYISSSAVGWFIASRGLNEGRQEIVASAAVREGLAALGIGVAVQILSQFERFAIPKVASIEMLATYAVLAAVVGSPFRMIQAGTSFSLLPRLRSASNGVAARSILLRETTTALVMSIVSISAIALVAPYVFGTILNAKYKIDGTIITAAVVVGLLKVWEGFSTTVVSACGSSRALATISALSWVCIGVAAIAMSVGARFGLAGIVYGVGAAWVLLCAGGTYLAVNSFHARFSAAPDSAT